MEGKIEFNIDVMLAKRKMTATELAQKLGITLANLSILKNGKAKALKISTLVKLCEALECQPGDLLEYRELEPMEIIEELIERSKKRHAEDAPYLPVGDDEPLGEM